jgi:hypothetical protein
MIFGSVVTCLRALASISCEAEPWVFGHSTAKLAGRSIMYSYRKGKCGEVGVMTWVYMFPLNAIPCRRSTKERKVNISPRVKWVEVGRNERRGGS